MGKVMAQFDGFTLREVDESDRAALDAWMAKDPHHQHLDANFFLGRNAEGDRDPRATCYAMEDGQGEVFFIRMSQAARVNIQFNPERKRKTRARTAKALVEGMAFLEAILSRAGVEEWIFETASPELANLATRRMGFRASPNELQRGIAYPEAEESRFSSVLPEQSISQEAR